MYRICTRCVMDTSDPDITFDENGHCNHCTRASECLEQKTFTGAEGQKHLDEELAKIKEAAKGNRYDCIIGLSGGVDSSYLAYKCKDWGLRPLLFHVDGGWNTPQSERNVQALAEYLNCPLERYTVPWEEMRDLQRAFLRSGVPNQDIPQDHLFFTVLFRMAKKHKLHYWLSGSNFVSESILPVAWGGGAMDPWHLSQIHKKFGEHPLRRFPRLTLTEYYGFHLQLGRWRIYRLDPLNFISYDPYQARKELKEKCGWEDYGGKHNESVFTRFFQNYFLVRRFGYDKRRAHYSSLIVAGQLSRERALELLEENSYPDEIREHDKTIILNKLGYSAAEFDALLVAPLHRHEEYGDINKFKPLMYKMKTLQNAIDYLAAGDFRTFCKKLKTRFIRG